MILYDTISVIKVCVLFVAQSCLTLCDRRDCSLPGSSVHGIPRQGYWSGLPFPFPGDLPDPGIEPGSPALQADSWLAKPLKLNILANTALFIYKRITCFHRWYVKLEKYKELEFTCDFTSYRYPLLTFSCISPWLKKNFKNWCWHFILYVIISRMFCIAWSL